MLGSAIARCVFVLCYGASFFPLGIISEMSFFVKDFTETRREWSREDIGFAEQNTTGDIFIYRIRSYHVATPFLILLSLFFISPSNSPNK